MRFADRRDAGRHLAVRLLRFRDADPVVLALPRGGVPVGYEVAQALGAPLDLLMVRKVGAPCNEEMGIGAVVDGDPPQVVLDDRLVRLVRAGWEYLDAEVARQLREMARRRAAYLGGRAPVPVAGRTALVVDDGIATGGTARAALRAVRRAGPERLVLAVPVAAAGALHGLAAEADEVVTVTAPAEFGSVGEHYDDFTQTGDGEVLQLLGIGLSIVRSGGVT